MFSLAPLRYRAVLASDGGPVEFVEEGEATFFGTRYFQANARLKDGLVPRQAMQIYCNADGSGFHSSPMVARHIAISEALERWAYYETLNSNRRATFGFHLDPSSNGMAAYPGLFVRGHLYSSHDGSGS